MSVYKPAKGRFWHFDFQLKGRRYYGSTGAETRRAAERVERKKREQAALGELDRDEQPIPTLDVAAASWWLTKQHLKTADALQLQATQLVEWIGASRPVNSITFSDVERAIQKRRGALVKGKTIPAAGTVNRTVIAVLRPILKHARQTLNDGSGPAVNFPEIRWGDLRQPEPKPKAHELSAKEMEAVLAAMPESYRDFARFQARYGCRLGEMFFRPEEVDVEGKRVRLRGRKAGDDHTIPLLDDDAAMLAARVGRAQAAKLTTVWFRESGRKLLPIGYETARSAIKRAFKKTGLAATKDLTGSKVFRHHAGMQILRASGNLRAAQKLLGHASITSTLVYAHAVEDDVRNALRSTITASPTTASSTEVPEQGGPPVPASCIK